MGIIIIPVTPLLSERVTFVVPQNAIPLLALRRMLAVTLTLAKALNVPLVIRAHASYLQSVEALLARMNGDGDHPIDVGKFKDQLKPDRLQQESISSFMVVPGFGSRQRVATTLGNLPERLAGSFDDNLAVLHFDK